MGKRNGFIMLEGLVGVAILGLVILFVISTFGLRVNMDKRNSIRATAFYLAEQGLERVKANPDGISAGVFTTEDFGTIPGFPKFRREYSFQQVSSSSAAIIWEVRVGVKWRRDPSSTPWNALQLVSYVIQRQ